MFEGFEKPTQNWSKLPHSLISSLPIIETVAELKIVLYVLRHTWGYNEFGEPVKITLDEFQHGRKRADGTRLDDGTGLSKPSVVKGCARAVKHGFLEVDVDDRDGSNIEKFYGLKMREASINQGLKDFTPDSSRRGKDILPPSSSRKKKDTPGEEEDLESEEPLATARGTGRTNALLPPAPSETEDYEFYWQKWKGFGLSVPQLGALKKYDDKRVLAAMQATRLKPGIEWPFKFIQKMLEDGFDGVDSPAGPRLKDSSEINDWADELVRKETP